MNEDEIIKILTDEIVALNIGHEKYDEAVKGLLDLYQQEKEKNGILKDELNNKINALDIAMSNPDYISKDKIKAKIEVLENKIHVVIPNKYNSIEVINEFKTEGAVDVLKELLEEE